MSLGFNRHKSRGFNYRPFYYDEEEKRREDIFGEVHRKHKEERLELKGSFRKKSMRRRKTAISNRMIRMIVILLMLVAAFVYIMNKEFSIPKGITEFFNG
jgi:hypothetical protein